MRLSQLFSKTRKEGPTDETAVNARLLERGGFIQKTMAGVYAFLPLGWRVLNKIENLIRREMNALGAQEILLPALQPKENWQTTGRWEGLDILFKIKSRHGSEYALGPTHEEIITPAAQNAIDSYKDLPIAVYQIQTKFRDEPRAKSGLLRGREFRMKDLYSFHSDEKDLDEYYQKVAEAYHRIFHALGLKAIFTEANGGTFSKFSHEFQIEIENGEDEVYVCGKCGLAKNKEIFNDEVECSNCGKTKWQKMDVSEVGNIFKLKNKFSDAFNLQFTAEDGSKMPVLMGCYGIGSSRLMGVLVEKFNDSKGITWPATAAPFNFHLIALGGVAPKAEEIYEKLNHQFNSEVLFDDRPDKAAGEKFADADLIGCPVRLVVSEKTLAKNSVELKMRKNDEIKLVDIENLTKVL